MFTRFTTLFAIALVDPDCTCRKLSQFRDGKAARGIDTDECPGAVLSSCHHHVNNIMSKSSSRAEAVCREE